MGAEIVLLLVLDYSLPKNMILQLRDSFGGVRLGAGLSLRQARAIEVLGDADKENNLSGPNYNIDRHRAKYHDTPFEYLNYFQDALPFLDLYGIKFFLPSYMECTLSHYGEDNAIVEAAINYLVPDEDFKYIIDEFYDSLDANQIGVISSYLNYCFTEGICKEESGCALEYLRLKK